MISSQALSARIRDLESLGIPFTNYGFSVIYQGEDALRRFCSFGESRPDSCRIFFIKDNI